MAKFFNEQDNNMNNSTYFDSNEVNMEDNSSNFVSASGPLEDNNEVLDEGFSVSEVNDFAPGEELITNNEFYQGQEAFSNEESYNMNSFNSNQEDTNSVESLEEGQINSSNYEQYEENNNNQTYGAFPNPYPTTEEFSQSQVQQNEEFVVSNNDSNIAEENNEVLEEQDLSNIEDSIAFSNVETTFVEDTTYKGVDNTGKVGEEIQNPVYDASFEKNDVNVSGNFLAVLLVLIEVLLSPGKSVIRNTEKYVKGKRVFKVTLTVFIYEFIFSMIGHIIGGCFVDRMSYGEYKKVLDFANITQLNYVNILINTAIVTLGFVFIIAIINYASSFFSNKGLSFGSYLLIAVLSFFPVVLAINALVPILNVMSIYLSLGLVIAFSFYSLLIYINALWGIMEFKGDNAKVIYLFINFVLITIILVIILLVFFDDYVNSIRVIFK